MAFTYFDKPNGDTHMDDDLSDITPFYPLLSTFSSENQFPDITDDNYSFDNHSELDDIQKYSDYRGSEFITINDSYRKTDGFITIYNNHLNSQCDQQIIGPINNTTNTIDNTPDIIYKYNQAVNIEDEYQEDKYMEDEYMKDKYIEDKYFEDEYMKDKYFDDEYMKDKYFGDECIEDEYMKDKYVEDEYMKDKYLEDQYIEYNYIDDIISRTIEYLSQYFLDACIDEMISTMCLLRNSDLSIEKTYPVYHKKILLDILAKRKRDDRNNKRYNDDNDNKKICYDTHNIINYTSSSDNVINNNIYLYWNSNYNDQLTAQTNTTNIPIDETTGQKEIHNYQVSDEIYSENKKNCKKLIREFEMIIVLNYLELISNKNNIRKGGYTCRICHLPKLNHICQKKTNKNEKDKIQRTERKCGFAPSRKIVTPRKTVGEGLKYYHCSKCHQKKGRNHKCQGDNDYQYGVI